MTWSSIEPVFTITAAGEMPAPGNDAQKQLDEVQEKAEHAAGAAKDAAEGATEAATRGAERQVDLIKDYLKVDNLQGTWPSFKRGLTG